MTRVNVLYSKAQVDVYKICHYHVDSFEYKFGIIIIGNDVLRLVTQARLLFLNIQIVKHLKRMLV